MRRVWLLTVLVIALASLPVFAQITNGWIDFSQSYYKIPVAKEGIYRLTYSDLQAAGFPVNAVDPRFIQLFHRGNEQSIYIKGQADTQFNQSDYIEFYGKKNDGTLDSSLYRPASLQPHKFYNLYSDTTAYFLTLNSSSARGLRMDSVQLVNVNSLAAENLQTTERLFIYHDEYSAGLTVGDYAQSTYFDQGEGWTGHALQQGNLIDYTIDSLYNGVTSGGNPKLEMLLVGRDITVHSIQILVGPNAGSLRLLSSPTFNEFETFLLTTDLLWSDVSADGKILVRVVAQSATTNRYQASVSYIKVTFPQSFDLNGIKKKKFKLPINTSGQSYLVITNGLPELKLWDVTDLRKITRILSASSEGSFNSIIPGTSISKSLFTSTEFIKPAIISISFRKIDPTSANYLIITNKTLMGPAPGYSNPVKAFAAYRASAIGGSYDTLTITIDQLYNQFNYGEVSPSAIFNFMKFIVPQGRLKYFFLIGKGRDIFYSPYRREQLAVNEFLDLVPSAGFPGADITYTAGLNGTTFEPAIPTGRLSATTPAQVAAYLNKVKELESIPLQPWNKELLHLSGGGIIVTDSYELAQFHQIVDGLKQIAEGPYLGGHVTTKAKQNLGIEKINIAPVVNQGVNLITYFGHASSLLTEIDIGFIDDPTLGYNNPGKYPAFLVNGCDAGAIFSNEVTFTDNWILAANKGSRNFIAGTSFGFSNLLQNYSRLFYSVGFGDSTFIKKGIGDIQKEACRQYITTYQPNIFNVAQVQQMLLAGDPSLKLFGTSLPDYSIDNGSLSLLSLDGKPVTSLSDSFAITIRVKNFGAYHPTPMKVRVIRTFNDNSSQTDSTYSPVLYSDTLTFKILKGSSNGFGNNLFTVEIDPLDSIKEISKANNIAILNAFIPSNGTINLYPTNFGIVGAPTLNLVFQDANPLDGQRNFLLQIDTVKTFNSPFTISKSVSGKVLAKSLINLLTTDSVVYYWRTKPVKLSPSDSSNWTTSSFIFIANSSEGWAQKKFAQVSDDLLTNLSANTAEKKLKYLQTVSQVTVKSIGANSSSPFTDASLKIDNIEYNVPDQIPCRNNTINLVAFNKATSSPYPGIYFYYDSRACGLQPAVINNFLLNEIETGNGDDLLQSIDNIQASDSVVLYSVGDPSFSMWSSNVLNKLSDLGISNTQITSLQDGEPVIIFSKKGSLPGSAKIFRSSTTPVASQDETVTATISGGYSSGKVKSPIIGPAKKWVKFTAQANEVQTTDQVSYSIYGVTLNGDETLIQSNITSNSLDLSFIDPIQYPQLKVELEMQDPVNQTAVQLKNWFVFYESVADGLLFYQGPLGTQVLQEGQLLTGQYGFANISSKSFMDSLQVNAQTITLAKGATQINTFKIKSPAPGDTTTFSFTINTKGKAGLNNVSVVVNPKIQPEQYYENNVIDLADYLEVLVDHSDPVLDVTVDGRYLQNNDFVSPDPSIQIRLTDDNPFLFITDTTHLTIFLSFPGTSTPSRIYFSRGDIQWSRSSAKSDFIVNFNPVNLSEGIYTLQVNGSDESNNASGTVPFEIAFQVKNETTLKLNSVYPNPSKDVFNFNFTLSGNILPDEFSLQIFSASGNLVQEFSLNDASNFIIGTNDLPWSAPSEVFQNGLFIYRLTIRVNGKTVSEDGKLMLIR